MQQRLETIDTRSQVDDRFDAPQSESGLGEDCFNGCEVKSDDQPPHRVMVVDDDPAARLLISTALKKCGFEVVEASDGREALERFDLETPDMVLLDVFMPGMDGFEACRAMRRKSNGLGSVPIVMVTGAEELDSIKRAYEAGATDFITKPINWLILIQRVRCILRAGQAMAESKRAGDALREREAQLRKIIDLVPHRIFVKDFDGKYLLVNQAAADIYNTSVQDLTGKNQSHFHPDADQLRSMLQDDREVMEKGQTKVLDRESFTDSQGRLHFFQTTKVPFHVADNKVQAVLGIAVDVTERKQAENERKKLQAQLIQAQKMEAVGRLAGGVAHDFNNMLGVILGHTELVLNRISPEDPLYLDLQEIHKAGERSADLTRQLLAFARKQSVNPKVLQLNDTVPSMIKMLRRLIGEDIDLIWKPGYDLWDVRIDPSQVDQVLANLAINARDAIAGAGKITIETSNISLDDATFANHEEFVPGQYVLLAVSDDGEGMLREVREHIFEPFFSTKELGKGTGLGLATVYGIVKQNQGFVYAYSEPGQGATFKVYLPRFKGEAVKLESKVSPGASPLGNETVLLVEDEPAVMSLGEKILARLGYTVVTAGTPEAAIGVVEEHEGKIQLLITDVIMPGMNGKELADRLTAAQPDLKCLFMSGYTEHAITQMSVLGQEVHFIQKPFSVKEIAQKVREVLDTG